MPSTQRLTPHGAMRGWILLAFNIATLDDTPWPPHF